MLILGKYTQLHTDEDLIMSMLLIVWVVFTGEDSLSQKSIPEMFGFLPSLSGLFLGK